MLSKSKLVPLLDLQHMLDGILKRPQPTDFLKNIGFVEAQMVEHLAIDSDNVLLTLVDLSGSDVSQYSSTHAMLVMALVDVGGAKIDHWDDAARKSLRMAALTMNLSMTELQDQLAGQKSPLTADQKSQIASHAQRSEELLKSLGCTDELWLEAVRLHHDSEPGPLTARKLPSQLARIIQRADVFASRLSPRKDRAALSASAAAQCAFLDEFQNPDQAGAALIKAVGIYPPGSWVGLSSSELGMVLRRGEKAHCPLVAALIGPDGMPYSRPFLRDTQDKQYAVNVSLPPEKIKFKPRLATLLRMA